MTQQRIRHPPRRASRVTISTTPQVIEALDALLATGLYGFSRADVAERLVAAGVRAAMPPVRLKLRIR